MASSARRMSMPNMSAVPTQPDNAPLRALTSAPIYKRHDGTSKPCGSLVAGETLVVLETKMDKRGKTWVHHAKGYTPTHSIAENKPLLAPAARSAAPQQQQQKNSRVAPPAVGARVVVRMVAPFFAKYEKDTVVRGKLTPGSTLEILEARQDSAGKVKVRHATGWTPMVAPDGSVVLEVLQLKSQQHAQRPPAAPAAEIPPLQRTSEQEPWPQPAATHPQIPPEELTGVERARHKALQRRHSVASLGGHPATTPVAQARGTGQNANATAVHPSVAAGMMRARNRVRSASDASNPARPISLPATADSAALSVPSPGTWYSARLRYLSGEQGFGLKFGVNVKGQPSVEGFMGEAARVAGIVTDSVIVSVCSVAVHTIQDLATVLKNYEQRQDFASEVEFTFVAPAAPPTTAAPSVSGSAAVYRGQTAHAAAGDQLLQAFNLSAGAQQAAHSHPGGAKRSFLSRRPSMAAIGESRALDGPGLPSSIGDDATAPPEGVPQHPKRLELCKLSAQVGAVSDQAVQLMTELPAHARELQEAQLLPFGSRSVEELDDLAENVADCESALQQQERTQCMLLEKQLRLLDSLVEEAFKQQGFGISEVM
jgi:hypothetical protein